MATVTPDRVTTTIVARRPLLEVWGPTLMMLVFMVGTVFYVERKVVPHVNPPAPVIDITAEGENYGYDRLRNYAANTRGMGKAIEGGAALSKAMADAKSALSDADRADYVKRFASVQAVIVPEGQEPTPEQRTKIAQMCYQIADGVEKIKGVK